VILNRYGFEVEDQTLAWQLRAGDGVSGIKGPTEVKGRLVAVLDVPFTFSGAVFTIVAPDRGVKA
jgi:hypothetical protein